MTLVLGREDKMTPNKRAAGMIEAFGDARTVYLDRVGHFLQIESPIPGPPSHRGGAGRSLTPSVCVYGPGPTPRPIQPRRASREAARSARSL